MQRSLLGMALLAMVGCAGLGDEDTEARDSDSRAPATPPADDEGGAPPVDDGDDGRAECGKLAKRLVPANAVSAMGGDALQLFWLEYEGGFAEDSTYHLRVRDFATGEVTTLATDLVFATGLEVTSDFVFVGTSNNRQIHRIARAGGELELVAETSGEVAQFAVDDDWLFYEAPGGEFSGARIYRMPADGTLGSATLFAETDAELLYDFELDGGFLYFGEPHPGEDNVIARIAVDGATDAEVVANVTGWPLHLEVSGDKLYATLAPLSGDPTTDVVAIDVASGASETLVETALQIYAFALDGADLFFTEGRDLLQRLGIDGGGAATLAAMADVDDPVAVGECVYFTRNEFGGAANGIYRVAR